MATPIIALLGLIGALCALTLLTVTNYPLLHFLMAGLVNLTVAVIAVRASQSEIQRGASATDIGSLNARFMGILWAFGAMAMFIVYGFDFLRWKEWWHFVLAFSAAAALSYVFALLLRNPGDNAQRLLKTSRLFAMLQLAGMVIVMLGLFIDGKMDKIGMTLWGPRDNPPADWPANNLFFLGALALAIMSWEALKSERQIAERGQ